MPLPQDALARQQDAIFRALGESAQWAGIDDTVRVVRREADETIRSAFSELVGTGRTVKVRKSEVPTPAKGDQVQVLAPDGTAVADARFEVNGEPALDRRAVWHCPVKVIP